MKSPPKFRVARPTANMHEIMRFYRDALGLQVLARFADHDSFDGVMLGWPGGLYHLEFTVEHGAPPPPEPSPENLIVFYLPDKPIWHAAVERMRAHGYQPVKAHNPYWNERGATFEDADGYRVVLENAEWTA